LIYSASCFDISGCLPPAGFNVHVPSSLKNMPLPGF
jgi:hypothetical protein